MHSIVLGIKKEVAEEEGFEPPVALTTPVFKTGAFNRSAIPPLPVGFSTIAPHFSTRLRG